MQAKERLYSTTDGRIVREGDPAGAYLKYGIGDEIGENFVAEVNDLTGNVVEGTAAAAYHDDVTRDDMRERQARPDVRNEGRPFYHDRLATELADEARERANRDEPLSDSDAVTSKRLYWPAAKDGNGADESELLPEGHPDAAFLAYAPGDKIVADHLDAFESMDDDTGTTSAAPEKTPPTPKKAAPAKAPAATS